MSHLEDNLNITFAPKTLRIYYRGTDETAILGTTEKGLPKLFFLLPENPFGIFLPGAPIHKGICTLAYKKGERSLLHPIESSIRLKRGNGRRRDLAGPAIDPT